MSATQPNDSNALNALDCISRQAAIEAISDLYWMDERLLNFKKEIDATFDKIKALPSAQPERTKGKWIDDCSCSICHWIHEDDKGFALLTDYHFCPNCGADMRKETEDGVH